MFQLQLFSYFSYCLAVSAIFYCFSLLNLRHRISQSMPINIPKINKCIDFPLQARVQLKLYMILTHYPKLYQIQKISPMDISPKNKNESKRILVFFFKKTGRGGRGRTNSELRVQSELNSYMRATWYNKTNKLCTLKMRSIYINVWHISLAQYWTFSSSKANM